MKTAGFTLSLLLLLSLAVCAPNPVQTEEISRERAIEIARSHVTFEPKSVEAEQATEEGRPVWRVTFRSELVSEVHPLGEVTIVTLDRRTGELVALATS